jgi:Xaa-Pro dipeptidase
MLRNIILSLFYSIIIFSCSENQVQMPFPMDENPWFSIRKERIKKLLPLAMQETQTDIWLVICRENNNDPLAMHVGGENASGTAAFMFFNEADSVRSLAISPSGEATALKEINLHDSVLVTERRIPVWNIIADIIKISAPKRIAINSAGNEIADGLSYTQRRALENALGEKYIHRLVSSEDLVREWLAIKLRQEIDIMRKAAEITAQLQIEAYQQVIPGKTKDSDVAHYLKNRMKELAVSDAWAPDQNPNVNSGPDRGHSHATDKIIQPGDVIQIDFGIKAYDIWCSDIQRFAYVLKPGETDAPEEIKQYMKNAITGHRKVLAAMRPGITGWAVDKVQRDWMNECGSLPVMWSTGHPVGYWAHDAGPALGGAARDDQPTGNSALLLKSGQTFAYDGFFTWRLPDGKTKTISVEEMAVVTDSGAEYLIAPQEEWILIGSR